MSFEDKHQEALKKGLPFYVDPDTGYRVLTRDTLLRQRSCCHRGCRHCPFGDPVDNFSTAFAQNGYVLQTAVGTLAVSPFARGHHAPGKPNTQFVAGPSPEAWAKVLLEVAANWDRQKPGYREGVILVPLTSAQDFTCPVVTLQDGDRLEGVFAPRGGTEKPRQHVWSTRTGTVATHVDVVLYHRDVLAEGSEHERTGADWEVVTLLGKLSDEPMPMPPHTLMANHFVASGGTSTQMTAEQFVEALRASWEFWQDKASVGGSGV